MGRRYDKDMIDDKLRALSTTSAKVDLPRRPSPGSGLSSYSIGRRTGTSSVVQVICLGKLVMNIQVACSAAHLLVAYFTPFRSVRIHGILIQSAMTIQIGMSFSPIDPRVSSAKQSGHDINHEEQRSEQTSPNSLSFVLGQRLSILHLRRNPEWRF